MGIQPDEHDRPGSGDDERNAVSVEDEMLEDETDEVEPQGSSQQFRQEEEGGSRAVGMTSEPFSQIGVDGSQVKPIVERQQQVCDDQVTEKEPHAHLQVSHVDAGDHARHGDKGHTGEGCPDHAEGNQLPRRLSIAAEEGIIVGPSGGHPCHEHQQTEVCQQDEEDIKSVHANRFMVRRLQR